MLTKDNSKLHLLPSSWKHKEEDNLQSEHLEMMIWLPHLARRELWKTLVQDMSLNVYCLQVLPVFFICTTTDYILFCFIALVHL